MHEASKVAFDQGREAMRVIVQWQMSVGRLGDFSSSSVLDDVSLPTESIALQPGHNKKRDAHARLFRAMAPLPRLIFSKYSNPLVYLGCSLVIASDTHLSLYTMGEELKSFVTLLLESGEHSDLTVVCGHLTFTAHKAIVCTQSEYFKTALNTTFSVSKPLKQTFD